MKIPRCLWIVFLGALAAGSAFAGGGRDFQALRAAAATGDVAAQLALAGACMFGDGVVRDENEALKWYRLAADQGFAAAQLTVGQMYSAGFTVARDDKEALRWYRLAADQGLPQAHLTLGQLYEKGIGVPQDLLASYIEFSLAAADGVEEAAKEKDRLARKLPAPERQAAEAEATRRFANLGAR